MVTEATSYNKQSGFYTIHPEPQTSTSPVGQEEPDSNVHLIDIPWDNDGFTLCLDSFPSTESSMKKYNKAPVTTSPLRMQWISPNDSSGGEDTSQGTESVSTTTNDSRPKRKKKTAQNASIDMSFPYINDDAFLDRIQPPPKRKLQKQYERKGRIQQISPLMNSSIIFDKQDILFKPSSSTTRSVSILTDQSHVSNTSTTESWKVAKSPLSGMKSPIVLPPNPTITREHNSRSSGSGTPHSYSHPPLPLTYSASVRSIGTNSISASGVYYTPTSVTSAQTSYRSMHVAGNADDLVLYIDSFHSSITAPSEKNRPYSQFFNPNYQQSRGKKPVGLFTKLMKNFKHHFAK